MITINRVIAGLLCLVMVMAGIAYAGQSSVPVTAGAGTNVGVVTTASGSVVTMGVVCDQAAGATCATVSGNALSVGAAQSGVFTAALGTTATSLINVAAQTGTVNVLNTVSVSPTVTTPVSIGSTITVSTANAPITVAGTVSTSPTGTTNVICLSGCSGSTGTDITKWATTALSSAFTYGQSVPATAVVGSVNAFVTSGTISVSGGVNVLNTNANGQATGANSSPVVIASDQPSVSVTISRTGDPCAFQDKTTSTIYTQANTQVIVPGVAGKKIWVCSFGIIAGAAADFSLVEATATGGSQLAVMGSTTATSGYAFAINGGMTKGDGNGTLVKTTVSSNYLLTLLSGGPVTLDISYIQQ